MSDGLFALEDVISNEAFPDVDLALRRGRHIDRDDGAWYSFLQDSLGILEAFYRRFGCELIHKSDGYFYLLPTSDKLGKRHLSASEMLVGQVLTLLYLDPSTVEHGGVVSREQILAHLAGVMGEAALIAAFNPKRRRYDERVAEETVRNKVADAVRRLALLGFVELIADNQVRLRPALLRFAEPVRGNASPEAALARLIASGEVALADETPADEEGASEDDFEADDDAVTAELEPEHAPEERAVNPEKRESELAENELSGSSVADWEEPG